MISTFSFWWFHCTFLFNASLMCVEILIFAQTDLLDGRSEANCGFFEKCSNCKRSLKSLFWHFQLWNLTQKSNVSSEHLLEFGHSQDLFLTWPAFYAHSSWSGGKYGGKRGSELEIEKTTNYLLHIWKAWTKKRRPKVQFFLQDYNLLKWVQQAEWCLVVCIVSVASFAILLSQRWHSRHSRRHAAGPTMQW